MNSSNGRPRWRFLFLLVGAHSFVATYAGCPIVETDNGGDRDHHDDHHDDRDHHDDQRADNGDHHDDQHGDQGDHHDH